MMNDMIVDQTKQETQEKPRKETYSAPRILIFGDVMTLARGSGSDESDGCSSGRYDD